MKRLIALLLSLALLFVPPGNASRTFNGSTMYFTTSSSILTALPYSFACWVRLNDLTTGQTIFSMGNSSGQTVYAQFRGDIAGDPFRAVTNDLVTAGVAQTGATGVTTGVWYHVAFVWTANNDRTVYFAGTGTNDTTASTPSAPETFTIGAFVTTGTTASFFDGDIAHPAIWNGILSAEQVASLAAGQSPKKVKPEALKEYWPMIYPAATDENGIRGIGPMTAVASPGQSTDEPRIYP